ncbi:MAG TPA: adenylate cyclase [Actinomycetaceae bacterium]|nr:adenylate cyclase [Actinomycetaceae bacterium]
MSESRGEGNFEFERRFFVAELPRELLAGVTPTIIVQTYFLARDGYGLRIRLQASNPRKALNVLTRADDALDIFERDFDACFLTAKGPYAGGTRYEAERELDINVGIEMSRRGGITIAKSRYSLWLGEDGWVIDEFAGDHAPLLIAECERGGPVVDLVIPRFCSSEVTSDLRFSNDALVNAPYSTWQEAFEQEYAEQGPRFERGFGQDRRE